MKLQRSTTATRILLLIAVLCIGSMSYSISYAGSDNLSFDVKVTIVARTCNLNDDLPIDIGFGMVDAPNIDGSNNYVKQINYTLVCEGAQNDPALKLRFSGQEASFGNGLLRTTEPNLAIKLKQGNDLNSTQEFSLNSFVNFQYSTPPVITATLVKSNSGGIDDGDFSASSTFTVEYQ